MEWSDKGTILGLRRHGETSVIVELMTKAHGRHLGLVRGGRSRKLQPILQPGNDLEVVWRARLEEHLGVYTIEPVRSRAADLMQSRLGLSAVQLLGAQLRLLPEREVNGQLFEALQVSLDNLNNPLLLGELLIRMELSLLTQLGFGLDLSCCASSGISTNLIYVSPKSGRAVSAAAGEPYKDRLLPLPDFLTAEHGETASRTAQDLENGFALSRFFMQRHIYVPRAVDEPTTREEAVRLILAAAPRSG
ncbi:MAG: DNA repair protein RecO [Hyphomicrobiales bacterium]|nr:DNA repair protein RecO [Hyphomicrobiales bacterium]PCJ90060.1 MAG: DNA repair protein RecO [Hyphomicrobiales bacterium]